MTPYFHNGAQLYFYIIYFCQLWRPIIILSYGPQEKKAPLVQNFEKARV